MKKKEKKPSVLATRENDIKYRGPLNYQILRIIGWVFMALSISATLLATGAKLMDKFHGLGAGTAMSNTSNAFSFFGSLAVPMFLLANFTIILNHRNQYLKLLVKFVGLAAVIYAGFAFAVLRYVYGIGYQFFGSYSESAKWMSALMKVWMGSKLYLNVFIDLLIVSLLFFFINYTPKKVFTGKKIYIFRAFVALPILYEIAAMLLKGLSSSGLFDIPLLVMPLFPTKPLLMILCFLVLILIIKDRERRYLKKGYTLPQFHEYLKTNKSSLMFSIQVSVAFVITALVDLAATLIFIFTAAGTHSVEAIYVAQTWGIGNSMSLAVLIPFVMLYSYNRKYDPKNRYDLFIALGGVGLVAFTAIETAYQIITALI